MMVCLDMGLIPLESDFSLMLKIICNFFDNFILSTVFISLFNYWTFLDSGLNVFQLLLPLSLSFFGGGGGFSIFNVLGFIF